MTSRLNIEPWPWQPELCSADENFIEWMLENRRQPWMAGTVFHMGTGEHHRVPRTCEALGLECIGITVSEDEYLHKPELPGYRCLLEDIYQIDYEKLPEIQFMTMFHLGEMADVFGEINAQFEQLAGLVYNVVLGGKVFFYDRSAAADRVHQFINPAIKVGLLKPEYQHYKNLYWLERTA